MYCEGRRFPPMDILFSPLRLCLSSIARKSGGRRRFELVSKCERVLSGVAHCGRSAKEQMARDRKAATATRPRPPLVSEYSKQGLRYGVSLSVAVFLSITYVCVSFLLVFLFLFRGSGQEAGRSCWRPSTRIRHRSHDDSTDRP